MHCRASYAAAAHRSSCTHSWTGSGLCPPGAAGRLQTPVAWRLAGPRHQLRRGPARQPRSLRAAAAAAAAVEWIEHVGERAMRLTISPSGIGEAARAGRAPGAWSSADGRRVCSSPRPCSGIQLLASMSAAAQARLALRRDTGKPKRWLAWPAGTVWAVFGCWLRLLRVQEEDQTRGAAFHGSRAASCPMPRIPPAPRNDAS